MKITDFLLLLFRLSGKKLPDLDWIESKGLLAVKIAQHFALRVDFLNAEVCAHLTALYTRTKPLRAEVSAEIIKNFSHTWRSNFTFLADEPFASASVGQVHAGTLQDGTDAVIKIRKADWAPQFIKDITRLKKFFKLILFFYPKLERVADPVGILDTIRDYTLSELDFTGEIRGAQTLDRIRSAYAPYFDLSGLAFPEYYHALSSEKCLVAKRIPGPTFDELLNKKKLPYEVLLSLFRLHGFYMFVPGIFHGDIHPGNIILSGDMIHFIDTGALGRVDETIRSGLFNFMESLCRYDFALCAENLHRMSLIRLSEQKFGIFKNKILLLYKNFPGKTVNEVSLTRQMMETIKLSVNCGMRFEKGMFGVIKSMMYLDGMVLRCKPGAVLIEDMRPAIVDFRKRINAMPDKIQVQV